MTRVYYSELLAKNALKAEEIRISILIPLCYYRELHIQISERARALLDLKVGVRIGGTFSTVTLGSGQHFFPEKRIVLSEMDKNYNVGDYIWIIQDIYFIQNRNYNKHSSIHSSKVQKCYTLWQNGACLTVRSRRTQLSWISINLVFLEPSLNSGPSRVKKSAI